ncbi:helix-turn-helix domain-containing protein [Amycolatopsis sp. NBC_01307]|uniref:helix-turn-helix domain-containing protein n=1 Tax=Amycolatopsis sp. NBC_01307 TaxID=2903561 RepID=UPI003FA39367
MTNGPSHRPALHVIGREVREIRTAQGISLRELARKLGLSPALLSAWETGERRPEDATLAQILGYLRVAPRSYTFLMRLH